MTALRPEHEAGYGGSYEQGAYEASGAFEAAAEGPAEPAAPLTDPLHDPLNAPLPGQRRGHRRHARPPEQEPPLFQPGEQTRQAADPESEWSGDYYRQYAAEPPAGQTNPYYTEGPTVPAPAPASSPGPAPSPAPMAPPPPVPSPVSSPAPMDDRTVALPVVEVPPDPGPEQPEYAAGPSEPAPRTGGRAERRKAAAKGGRGRRRAEPARSASGASASGSGPGSASASGSEGETPARPLSRVEARRAARAAKDSLAVVASRAVGELFITFGVLMLLFVTYQLWWTNVRADQIAGNETNKIQQGWAKGRQPGVFEPGQGFAIMHIPKLDVVVPIAEGISKAKVLDRGMVGHYAEGSLKTAMPSDKQGNFAVAGHRNTHGEPFRYINQLTPGDKIVVETQDAYYTYDMTSILPQTSPSNVSVIGPVPPGSGFTGPGRYITLTTCTPEFTSTYRMIVWGKMVEERPRGEGKPDALVG
ncbi:class E sortase [Streptomyces sp. GMY02]|uniref:class E sortase n=1 Tax=Streptomyces sp. GMY02 TaxID=1333528 RepID=UPI001C2CBE8F|nr:class E sortase [Streptomyces sp. GMY02]QXE35770.1 class E sortase [Streptomyces sp. GMY02]